jgi:hypothetical protein
VNPSAILDCHTHCYPPEASTDPRAWAEAHDEAHWAELVAPLGRRSIQGWATPDEMLTEMDQSGVKTSILLGWYWENESTCRWHNQVIAEWVRRAPDRFIGFASILPNEQVIDQLEAAKALGLKGVGELHTGMQHFSSKSPAWQALASWCVQKNWPINLHATEANGNDHPSSIETPLQDFIHMAEAAPELKLILAHWGGGLPALEKDPALREILKNVYYDTSATPLLYDMSIFRSVIDAVGAEKILYGSDYPLRVYPRTQKKADMSRFLDAIRENAQLSDAEMDAILGGNLRCALE